MRIKRLRLKIDAGTLSGNLSKDDKGRSLCILNKSDVGQSFWRHKLITPNVTTRADNHEPRIGA